MSETTDETFEIVTDADTIWSVDNEGNTYSYQLTEAERLQDSAHSAGFIPDDLPADLAGDPDGDKGDGDTHNGVQAGALLRSADDGDGEMALSETTDETFEIVTDADTIWSVDNEGNTYSYQLTEAERLQDAAHSAGFIPDDLPADLAGDPDGDKGDGDALAGDEALAGDPNGADMAMAALMDVHFLDMVF